MHRGNSIHNGAHSVTRKQNERLNKLRPLELQEEKRKALAARNAYRKAIGLPPVE